jgi:RHS repeat-associated protein
MPYKFTSKERDPETGLDYFGWRYYDSRIGLWNTVDPALRKYLPNGSGDEKLPGMGGVYNSINLNMYQYAGLNPVKYTDPDGNWFGFDDVFTGPVDEIIVIGGLSLAATCGSKWAYDKREQLSKLASSIISKAYSNLKSNYALAKGLIQKSVLHAEDSGNKEKKKAPPANNGESAQHGGEVHDNAINEEVDRMLRDGYTDIRKNQRQTDAEGNVVGNNRPDVQGTNPNTGQREHVEIDRNPANGLRHERRIYQNDPNSNVIRRTLK